MPLPISTHSNSSGVADQSLYTDREIVASLDKIDTLDFHQELEVNGIKFTAFHAGHVLGAAMFLIEIAGVKVLYIFRACNTCPYCLSGLDPLHG